MKTRYTVALLLLGLVLPTGEVVGQQAGPTVHRYVVRAVLTAEGLKNLQKQPPTALKAGVAKKPLGITVGANGSTFFENCRWQEPRWG